MLEIGDIIDRYKVEAIIGTGGTAMVYRVKHEALGTRHALKVLTVTSDVIRDRMILEGRVQASMRHPNIVAVTDVLDVDGQPGLLMEYIEGPSLHKALKEYKLPLAAAEMLFNGIVSAVRAAHAIGLVHRDLKPANVLLARVGDGFVPKVTDFGLAKMIHDSEETGHGHTRAGIAMGTPAYMASEQIRDAKTVDQRADIFSLGCMLYELACGQRAFPGDDAISIYNSVIKGVYTPPRQLVPGLPERIDAAIRGALVTDRKHRIPDCDTLLRVFHGEQVWELNEASEPELEADPPTTESARPAHPDAPELRIAMAPPIDDEDSGVRPQGLMPLGGQFLNLDDQTTDMRDDGVDPLYATIGAAGAHIEPYNLPGPEPTVEVTQIPVAPPPPPDRTSIVVWGGFAIVVAGMFFGALVLLWATGLFGGQGAPVGGRVKPTPAVTAPLPGEGDASSGAEGDPANPAVPAGDPAVDLNPVAPVVPPSVPGGVTGPPGPPGPTNAVVAPKDPVTPRDSTSRPISDPEPAGSNPPMNPTPRPVAPVTVKILSAPPTADLVVDGREAGRTPAKLDLKPGEHSVVLTSGEQVAKFKVVVGPEGEQRWCYAFATQTLVPGSCPR